MKKVGIMLLMNLMLFTVSAQKNSFKLNVGHQMFSSNVIAVNYERKIVDHFSINLRANFGSKKAIPYTTFYDGIAGSLLNSAGIYTNVFDTRFITYGGQLQFRYFPKGAALGGLYLAPYFGYQHGKIQEFSFLFPDSNDPNINHDGTVSAHFNFFGGGIGLGNQWVLGNGLTFDIMWVGLGWGTNRFNIHGESHSPAISFAEIDTEVNDFIDETPGFDFFFRNLTTSYTPTSMDMNFKHGFPYIKTLNFSIGYSF